ncbi:MAG: tRNA (adenosine(37)-N6)-threonylcarbamoyltransferase complex dimerization subunit type 1 TsaB [Planctomycetota bacterium]
MIQLAVETIGSAGALAILKGKEPLRVFRLPESQRAAQSFAVELDQLIRWSETVLGKLPDYLSVAVGPGSFTGLRIGITAAKMLGFALNVPIVPVGSLAAIATAEAFRLEQIRSTTNPPACLVGLNAFRGQVFSARYSMDELRLNALRRDFNRGDSGGNPGKQWTERPKAISRELWAEQSRLAAEEGVAVLYGQDPERDDVIGVGLLAAGLVDVRGLEDASVSPFDLTAHYVKRSAAEEKVAGH